MHRHRSATVHCILAAMMLLPVTDATGALPQRAPASVALPAELQGLLTDYENAWAAGDENALAALFTEDGFVLPRGAPPVRGRPAIREHYANSGGPLALRAIDYSANGDTAFIIGGYARESGSPDVGKFTLTLRRVGGRWLIVSDMDSGNTPNRARPQWNTPALQRLMHEWDVKLEKLELHLRPAMQRAGIDMWITMSREFNLDPMLQMFGDYGISGWYGHRNAYVFYDPGNGEPLERTLLGTHQSGRMREFFPTIIGYGEEGLKPHLAEFIAARDPQRIAINRSRTVAMADGITAEMLAYLEDAIGPEYSSRLVSAQDLIFDYISHRTPAELEIETEAQASTQVPWLGSIPILGYLFKNRSQSTSTTRFFVFLRANVLRNDLFADLKYLSRPAMAEAGVVEGLPMLKPRVIR